MLALIHRLQLETTSSPQFLDITQEVQEFVRDSRIQNGCVVIYSKHTTGAIRVNENEPLLIQDLEEFLERIASRDGYYHHNDLSLRTVNVKDEEYPNGHAHCQHLLLGASETIPIVGGVLEMGQWQSVFFVELDRPRTREVILQVLGE